MRAFFGLEVPESARSALLEIRARLEAANRDVPHLRWTSPEHLHLTVRFLGNVDPSVVDALIRILRGSLRSFGPVPIQIDGVSWFPRHRPTVLAARVSTSDRLLDLYDVVEAHVAAEGLPSESRLPNPHITIARIKQRRRQVQDVYEPVETAFVCNELVLFESRLLPTGASYSHYAEIPFGDVPLANHA